jgi:hypothetical protein
MPSSFLGVLPILTPPLLHLLSKESQITRMTSDIDCSSKLN